MHETSISIFHGAATTSSAAVNTIPLSGAGYVRLRTRGSDIYYAFWSAETNSTPLATLSAVQIKQADRLFYITTDVALADGQQVEIRADDGVTVKVRGYIARAEGYQFAWQFSGQANNMVYLLITSAAPASPLAADDQVFQLVPSATGPVGQMLKVTDTEEAVVCLPGFVSKGGALAFVRAGSDNANVVVERIYPVRGCSY